MAYGFHHRVLALAVALACAAPAHARPITAKDLANLDRVGDPQLSPDGRFLVYDIRSTDWDGNKGAHALWIQDRRASGLAPRKLAISAKGATSPRWSPDGKSLYVLSSRGGSQQVWRTDADGVEATAVTNLPLDVGSYRIAPSGKTLVVSLDVYPDCDTLACSKARGEARKANPVSAQAYDALPYVIWDAWRGGARNELFAIPLDASGAASATPVRLMKGLETEAPAKPFGDDGDYTPSDRDVIFEALEPGAQQGVADTSRLYRAPLDGSAPPAVVSPAEPGAYGRPTYSADGSRLAFVAQKGHGGGQVRAAVMVKTLATGEVREVDPGFDRSVDRVIWSADGKTLYGTVGDTGAVRLVAIDVAKAKVTLLTTGGQVTALTRGGERLVYAKDGLGGPGQLYELEKVGSRPLTTINAERLAGVDFSAFEQFSFPGWNGETVHGYVVKPTGYQEGRKYPTAFLIHGGPHGSFGDAWSYRWNPQVWAGMGYAVVMIDFHGSSGYGEAFAGSIVGHWGDRPLEDLQKGWAAAQAKYPWINADRACALGGSYGGYMVAWIAGAWNKPWKCLVNHDGILDTRSMALSTDIPGFSEIETGGLVWAQNAAYERFNPLTKVGDWRVPMLVVHGGRDYRVPLDQGLAAFTAAQRKGVPSRLVYFPDENQWVLKPQNSVEWYREVERWMKRWIGEPKG